MPHDTVRSATAYKYLGVLFTADTKWTQHIEQVVLPKLRGLLGQLRSTVTNYSVLCQRTALAVMKRYAASAVLHGMAVWGRPCLAMVPRALQRTTQQSVDTIDKLFTVTLKAIVGLNRKSCELATWREFG